ncbi:trehalose operon repressor [Streptococcus ratti]|uniref:Trehalose operon repressor n=2 Tax=Streptococcus ratti TaxID=1341 RepID=A0A7X9QHV7_STRRT|nr:trehalose operon repressor [Streptococcus ratti]VEI60902.1 transcriptional regulator [Streptococcus mutans]EJN94631.1 putative transcriptional regulator [Streptococcus ratti FA-1 = DSM 20564]EMP71409.1 transcriptional regulator [Streptococcus ratti FA-1 = DSM 20564]NMD49615.1 trehalose operon repressor [Streptococcus ratti]QEY06558.1 trehalose operon repressor [Streptococcus ratti]
MKKYEVIFQELQKAIADGKYQIGDYLPTETQLCQNYACSRDTVRKALQQLVKAGLIKTQQGRGSQVIKHEQIDFPVSQLTSYQELVQQLHMNSETNVIAIDKLIVDSKLAKLTGFAPRSLLWRITRQRVVDGVASVLDTDYLDKSLVPDMTREIAEYSIYDYLENKLKLDIAYAKKEITIDQITEKDKILLDIDSENHVVSVKSKVYLSDERQLQFTESRHKLEKFKFVDFARRQKD